MLKKSNSDKLIIQSSSKPGSSKKLDKSYQASAIKAAKDLGYSEPVIVRLRYAKSDIEIDRIMRTEVHKRLR